MAVVTSFLRCTTAAALALHHHHHQPALLAVRLRFPRHRIPTSRAMSSSPAADAAPAPAPHQAGPWYAVPDLSLRGHRFAVPLDHSSPGSPSAPRITVFGREVVAAGKEEAPLPYLVYLQGGPGYESPRPTEASGWVKKACEEYRVLLLDQVHSNFFGRCSALFVFAPICSYFADTLLLFSEEQDCQHR
uniref:AB hydrolase-1 domain-containing protein n=1 Tax=Aegilops tauschii subsp. strangulata TaxID=200361 RepID=A0A453QTR1_AEGTS